MLGSNGGLLGAQRTPSQAGASGVWFQNEQSLARRANAWPLAPLGSIVFGLDAQYYTSGQTFSNSAAPADGSAQSAYDFFLGSSSGASSDDPAFTSAGNGSYFTFDGNDFFTFAGGAASTTFLKNLHKVGANFSIEVWFYHPGTSAVGSSFFDSGTSDQGGSDMSRGVIYTCTDPAGQQLRVKQDSAAVNALSVTASTPFTTGIHMAGISYSANGTSFFYRDGAYDQVSGSDTFTATLTSPGTNNTVNAPRIGVRGDGLYSFVPTGTKLYRIAIYNTALSKSEFDLIWSIHSPRFGLGAADPSTLSPTRWWDASDLTSLTLVSGKVSQWNDKSGNGANLVQATDASRPSYTDYAVNGLGVVDWGSTSNDKNLANAVSTTGQEVYMVVKYATTGSVFNDYVAIVGPTSNAANGWTTMVSNDGSTYFTDWQWYLGSDDSTNRRTALFPEIKTPGLARIYRTAGSTTETGITVGVDRTFYGGRGWRGYICEIVVFNSPLSAGDRNRLRNYFYEKWGLGPSDAQASKVDLLLHCNGADASTTFLDSGSYSRTTTNVNSVAVSTTQKKFGNASMYFDGSAKEVRFGPIAYGGSEDFTFECWIYPTSTSDNGIFGVKNNAGSNIQGLAILSNQLYFHWDGTQASGSATIPTNTWTHIAMTRSSGTVRGFVNGTLDFTAAGTNTTSMLLYTLGKSMYRGYFVGYMDDIRITRFARYTASFAKPTAPYVDTPATAGTAIPVASITYSQSSVYGSTTPASAANMSDKSGTTGAGTVSAADQWIQMDLGSTYDVRTVVIGAASNSMPGGWNYTYSNNKEIQYSTNGTTWTTAFITKDLFSSDGEILEIAVNFSARYIRMYFSGYVAMTEFYALASLQTF